MRLKDIKLRHVSGRSIGVIPVRRGVVGVNRKIQVESPQVGGRHPGRSDPASPDPGHQEISRRSPRSGESACSSPPRTDTSSGPPRSLSYFKTAAMIAGAPISASTTYATLAPSWPPSRSHSGRPPGMARPFGGITLSASCTSHLPTSTRPHSMEKSAGSALGASLAYVVL